MSRIAADIIKDERTGPYFQVRITIDPGEIERLKGRRLVPGMPVETFIQASERSMLSYLLKPLAGRDQLAVWKVQKVIAESECLIERTGRRE